MSGVCSLSGLLRRENFRLYDQHAALRVVRDPVGRVAEQATPEFRMVAVADDDEAIAALLRHLEDILGGVALPGLAGARQAVLGGDRGDFLLPFLEILGRRLGFTFRFAGQVRVARQRFAHP